MTLSREEIEAAFSSEGTGSLDNTRCKLGRIINEHEYGELLNTKVNDATHYSAPTIAKVLKRLDLHVSSDIVLRHRSGDCRCPKGV